jgi:DNA (cytosine-5)-methyltransferase 1
MGYHRAGFDVVGIDIKPQPRYPFLFIQADALKPPVDLKAFDVIHASPPCQAYTAANNIHKREDHPDLIAQTRALLIESSRPFVIENVPLAPLRYPVTVCGLALKLGVKRHRLFESNQMLFGTQCIGHEGDWVTVFGHTVLERSPQIGRTAKDGPIFRRKHLGTERGRTAMRIAWMTREELSEAIPPDYTEFIGRQLREHL